MLILLLIFKLKFSLFFLSNLKIKTLMSQINDIHEEGKNLKFSEKF